MLNSLSGFAINSTTVFSNELPLFFQLPASVVFSAASVSCCFFLATGVRFVVVVVVVFVAVVVVFLPVKQIVLSWVD